MKLETFVMYSHMSLICDATYMRLHSEMLKNSSESFVWLLLTVNWVKGSNRAVDKWKISMTNYIILHLIATYETDIYTHTQRMFSFIDSKCLLLLCTENWKHMFQLLPARSSSRWRFRAHFFFGWFFLIGTLKCQWE